MFAAVVNVFSTLLAVIFLPPLLLVVVLAKLRLGVLVEALVLMLGYNARFSPRMFGDTDVWFD